MPGQMMHLYVGNCLWQEQGLRGNRSQFLLGCIAPDGVNAKGFAPKKIRWRAHLRARDLGVWKENALRFYQGQQGVIPWEYLLGYLVHVYTDILWDELFNPQLERSIRALTQNEDKRDFLRWSELFLFDRLACFQDWWKHGARREFARARALDINGISSTMIELLQKDTLFWYANTIEEQYGTAPPCFVTQIQAENLASAVIEQVNICE